MITDKWLAKNCWVNEVVLDDIPFDLKEYHPRFKRSMRSNESYNMDLISKEVSGEYYIQVSIDGYNGTAWNDKTKKLLDNTPLHVAPKDPNKLISAQNIDLSVVVGDRFGDWQYVTITVDLEQKSGYREYTTTLKWRKSAATKDAAVSEGETGYKWRD